MRATAHPAAYREIWESKPALREIYHRTYRRMAAACRPGRVLEIGGGSGNFKAVAPEVVSSDVLPAAWLDLVCDAQLLPFAAASFDNIVMFDVLHHLERPRRFFEEAQRVLRSGGRIVMAEPAITPLSWPVYAFLHPEPVALGDDPLEDGPRDPDRDPYDANQAIPTLLFGPRPLGGGARRFAREFPALAVVGTRLLSLLAYPLSGGFRRWSLLPAGLVAPLLRVEDALMPVLGPLMAFRMLVVLERR